MLFIFDWDGTISDSTDKIVKCVQQTARQLELPEPPQMSIINAIGLGLPQVIRQLYPDIGKVSCSEFQQTYGALFVQMDQKPCDFFPGVMSTLKALRQQGHLLAIATGKSRKGIDRVLKSLNLDSFFDSTRCADETRSKPDPLMLNEILIELAVNVGDAVMVGDTEYDMQMAVNVGMDRIAVSYGAHDLGRLTYSKPELCIDNFEEILAWHRIAGLNCFNN